jgi:hypothetical protein
MKETDIDYSEVYRAQELKQLNKRLRKTRNILMVAASAVAGGGLVFWALNHSSFSGKKLLLYLGLSFLLMLLAFVSNKKPYKALVTALVLCIGFWTTEIVLNKTDDLLIEGVIHKLLIIALLVSCMHTSREAELIRKELQFS